MIVRGFTILSRSRMCTSLVQYPDWLSFPPNNTACLSSVLVKEKLLHGGGLDPVTTGEDHFPIVQETDFT